MNKSTLKTVALLLSAFLFGCKITKFPSETYEQYEFDKFFTYSNNTLRVTLKNPLHCPLRIWFYTSDKELQKKFDESLPIVLQSTSDTSITLTDIDHFDNNLDFSSLLGNPLKKTKAIQVEYPFLKNKEFSIMQENNTNFTHNTEWTKYALDFDLKTNDTVCSATNGYVVGVVDQYKYGGIEVQWEPFSNFITVYEPTSGLFFQYVHLVHRGSLVKVGDKVSRGQKIGLSGNTGQSSEEHLHFSCLTPTDSEDGLKSVPIKFVDGKKSTEFKEGDKVSRVYNKRP